MQSSGGGGDGRTYRTDQWKALYAGLYPDGDILNAVWKSRIPIRKFERLIYLPEAPEFPSDPSRVFYNIWRKSGVEAQFGDVKPFLDHMAFLFPNEGTANWCSAIWRCSRRSLPTRSTSRC